SVDGLNVRSVAISEAGSTRPFSSTHEMPNGGTGITACGSAAMAGRHLNELASVKTNGRISMSAKMMSTTAPRMTNNRRMMRHKGGASYCGISIEAVVMAVTPG